jgi:hypothetical protein
LKRAPIVDIHKILTKKCIIKTFRKLMDIIKLDIVQQCNSKCRNKFVQLMKRIGLHIDDFFICGTPGFSLVRFLGNSQVGIADWAETIFERFRTYSFAGCF